MPSDGIYQYFSGKFTRTDSFVHFNLNEVVVNYFEQSFRRDKDGHFEVIRRANNFEGKVTTQGINIDSVIFKKTGQLMVMISEHPALFNPLFKVPNIPPSAVLPMDAMLPKL